jgi:O-antigen/teichoic acid export membrane protein
MGLALLGHLALIASPGISVIETRNVAATNGGGAGRVQAVLGLRLTLSLVLTFVAILTVTAVIREPTQRLVFSLSALCLVPMAVWVDWYFQGMEKSGTVATGRIVQYAVYGIAAVILVRAGKDAGGAIMAFYTGLLAGGFFLLARYRALWGTVRIPWAPRVWKEVLLENLPSGAAVFFGQMVTNLPPLVIGFMLTLEASGLWSAAMKLVFLGMAADRILNIAFLPLATRLLPGADGADALRAFVKATLVAAPVFAACGAAAAAPAMTLVFGPSYAPAVPLVRILMLYLALTLMNTLAVCILVGARHERAYVRRMIAGSVVLAAAVLVLTPLYGITGSAWGVVLGEAATLAFTGSAAFGRVLPIPPRDLLRWAVALAIGAVAGALAGWGSSIVAPLVGAVTFCAAVLFLRLFTGDDVRRCKEGLA